MGPIYLSRQEAKGKLKEVTPYTKVSKTRAAASAASPVTESRPLLANSNLEMIQKCILKCPQDKSGVSLHLN